jgi:DNA-binding LacI/PurR family transcriptional regulator
MPRPVYGTVRIEDVARRAGVSRATASRVLGASAASTHVSAQTAAQVRRAADELGYQPNPVARALASGGGYRVVIAVVAPTVDALEDAYVGRFVTAAARVADAQDVGVGVQWLPLGDPAPFELLAADRSALGVVLINSTTAVLDSVPQRLRGRVVSVGIGCPGVTSVDVDNAAPATLLVRHLLESGRRKVAMVTGPRWLPCCRRPLAAYLQTMRDAGRPARTVEGDFTVDGGRRAAAAVLRRWPDTDAIHAICDAAALGVLSVLADRGLRVPDDLAVSGFDDILFASLSGLTTATHPVERIAATAVQTVIDSPSDPPPSIWFGSRLLLRRSA